jgi:hypothetical protein
MIETRYEYVLLAALAALACACGGDDDSGSASSTGLGGIYEMTAWTHNETGCASEGPSILDTQSDKFLMVRGNRIFGVFVIEIVPCASLTDCRAEAMDSALNLTALGLLDSGSDSAGWTGGRIFAGGSSTCSGEVTETALRAEGAMAITIEAWTTKTGEFPLDSEGFCSTDDAKQAAQGKPCSELQVLRATLVESLP